MDEYRMARRVGMEERKWRAGTRETEVRLDGWCEGRFGQQRNDSGGFASMHKRPERVESPSTHVTELVSRCHFCLALCFFGPSYRSERT